MQIAPERMFQEPQAAKFPKHPVVGHKNEKSLKIYGELYRKHSGDRRFQKSVEADIKLGDVVLWQQNIKIPGILGNARDLNID